MLSVKQGTSHNNSSSTTGRSSRCSSQAEGNTNGSGRQSRTNGNKERGCTSTEGSRESSSARSVEHTECCRDGVLIAACARAHPEKALQQRLSKLQPQNLQQQGKQQRQQQRQQQHETHHKMSQRQDQQQRRQQYRRPQLQVEKDDGDLTSASAWPSLSAGRSRAYRDTKQLTGANAGGRGVTADPVTDEISGTRKELQLDTVQSMQATGNYSSAGSGKAEPVPESKSVATASGPAAKVMPQTSATAELAEKLATSKSAADKGDAAAVVEGSEGGVRAKAPLTATGLPPKKPVGSSKPPTGDAVLQIVATAGKPPAIATAGPRTACKACLPTVPSSAAGASNVCPPNTVLVRNVALCVHSGSAVEPRRGKPPRRAPWYKSSVSGASQKQQIDQSQHDPGAPPLSQQQSDKHHQTSVRQHVVQPNNQTKEETSAAKDTRSMVSAREKSVTADKGGTTDGATAQASEKTAASASGPLRHPAEALPATGRCDATKAAEPAVAPDDTADKLLGYDRATEGRRRQQQGAKVEKVVAQNITSQQGENEAVAFASPAVAGSPQGGAPQRLNPQQIPTKDHEQGLSPIVEPARSSGDKPPTVAASPQETAIAASPITSAEERKRPIPAKHTSTATNGENVSLFLASPEALASPAVGSTLIEEESRCPQQQDQEEPQASGRHVTDTSSFREKEDVVSHVSISVQMRVTATSVDGRTVNSHTGLPLRSSSRAAAIDAAGSHIQAGTAGTLSPGDPDAAFPPTPHAPDGEKHQTVAAAGAATAASENAVNESGRDVERWPRLVRNSQQHQQHRSEQGRGNGRPFDTSTASTTEENSDLLQSRDVAALTLPDSFGTACAVNLTNSPLSPASDEASLLSAAVSIGAAASGMSRFRAGATGAPVPIAVGAAVATAAVPSIKSSEDHAEVSETWQERQPPAAIALTTTWQRAQRQDFSQCLSKEKEVQLQQQQKQQDRENDKQAPVHEAQQCGQQQEREESLSYGKKPPAQPSHKPETSKGEGEETGVIEEMYLADERRGRENDSAIVGRREVTETEEALSIPLTSTILADRRSVFYKTQLCPHAVRGRCRLDEQCNFAHSRRELRPPPRLDKTKICASIKAGVVCPNGQRCLFAHNREELRHSVAFYKTNMCRNWISGACMHPHTCNHAHGMRELFFFRTLAAVAGCRDFRRERLGLGAAVAAASTPSKAASVAAALDSLRRRLAAAHHATSTIPTAATGTRATRGVYDRDHGGVEGIRSPAAASARHAEVSIEKHGTAAAAPAPASRSYAAGPPDREGGGRHAVHIFSRGLERQRRGVAHKVDAGIGGSGSGSGSDSTLTLDSNSSSHRYSDGSSSSSNRGAGGGYSGFRDRLYSSSTCCNRHIWGASSSNMESGPPSRSELSGNGGVPQHSDKNVLQQQSKNVSSKLAHRLRISEGGSTCQLMQPRNKHADQHQCLTSRSSRIKEGNLDDLVTLIPLLPDKEREFAELLLAYIEASAADKDNAASLVLSIPTELTSEAGSDQASTTAGAAAGSCGPRDITPGGRDSIATTFTEKTRENNAAQADHRLVNAVASAKRTGLPGGKEEDASFDRIASNARSAGGKHGPGLSGGAALTVGEVRGAKEQRTEGGNREEKEGAARTEGCNRTRGPQELQYDGEMRLNEPACCSSNEAAEVREPLRKGQDLERRPRVHCVRRHVFEGGRARTAMLNVAFTAPQHQQQKQNFDINATGGAETLEGRTPAVYDTHGRGTRANAERQQELLRQQMPEEHLLQRQKQSLRDSSVACAGRPYGHTKARQIGRRCGRKNGAHAGMLESRLHIRKEQLAHVPQSLSALNHQTQVGCAPHMRPEDVNRVRNLSVNRAEERNTLLAADAAEHEQQQHQQQPQQEAKHEQLLRQQLLSPGREELTSVWKKGVHQSWAATAAAGCRGKLAHKLSELSVSAAGGASDAVPERHKTITTGELQQNISEISFASSELLQCAHEHQRQHLPTHKQQQLGSVQGLPPEASQGRQQWRDQLVPLQQLGEQEQRSWAGVNVDWSYKTPRGTRRASGGTAAVSGRGPEEERETLMHANEASTCLSGVASLAPKLTIEPPAIYCSSDVTTFAAESCLAPSTAAAGCVYQTKQVSGAQQPTCLQHALQQQQQLQSQHDGSLMSPGSFPNTAAALVPNRDTCGAAGRKVSKPQLPALARPPYDRDQQQGEQGPGAKLQRWEDFPEESYERQTNNLYPEDEKLTKPNAYHISSQLCLNQSGNHPKRQQRHTLPLSLSVSDYAPADKGRSGEYTQISTSELSDLSLWQYQTPLPLPHAEGITRVKTSQLQQPQERHGTRHPWQQHSEQQHFQQQRQAGANGMEQHQQKMNGGEQRQQCGRTLSFNVATYPLLWRLFEDIAAVKTTEQLQQQQREREIRAAVHACWDDNADVNPAEAPFPALRVAMSEREPYRSLASPVTPCPAALSAVLHSAGAEAQAVAFSYPAPTDMPAAEAAFPTSCGDAASERSADPGLPASSSQQVNALAAGSCAAAILAAFSASAATANSIDSPKAGQATNAAIAVFERGLGKTALHALPNGVPAVQAGDSASREAAAVSPLQQQLPLPCILEAEQQHASATAKANGALLASFLLPLKNIQRAICDERQPQQEAQLLTAQQLPKEDDSSQEAHRQATAPKDFNFIYTGGGMEKKATATSERCSNTVDVTGSENSATLLQRLFLEHDGLPASSTSSRPIATASSSHTSAPDLPPAFPTATTSSGAAAAVPATAPRLMTEDSAGGPAAPTTAVELREAFPGVEHFCNMWEEGDTAKTSSAHQTAYAQGDRRIQQHALLQLGRSDTWEAIDSTVWNGNKDLKDGGAEPWKPLNSDEGAWPTLAETRETAVGADCGITAAAAAKRAGLAGNTATPAGVTLGSTPVRLGARGAHPCDGPLSNCRRRAKSFAISDTAVATAPRGTGFTTAPHERRRTITTDVRVGENGCIGEAEIRAVHTRECAQTGTGAATEKNHTFKYPSADVVHIVTGGDGSTTAGALGGQGERAGTRYNVAEDLPQEISAACIEKKLIFRAEPTRSTLPTSPSYMCSSLTRASSSSFASSSSPAAGLCNDRDTVPQHLPVVNHEEEPLPVGGCTSAVTGASPAWSYSASTAAASDDCMDSRLMLLPHSYTVLNRVSVDVREAAARTGTGEGKKQHQESEANNRTTSGLARSADVEEGVQLQLVSPQQPHQHAYQGPQLSQQHPEQPHQQPQQQHANQFFSRELLSADNLALRSTAGGFPFPTTARLKDRENSAVPQQQQQQRRGSAAAPHSTEPHYALQKRSVSEALGSTSLSKDCNGTNWEMATRHADTRKRSGSGIANTGEQRGILPLETANLVDYLFSCDNAVSSSNSRWGLSIYDSTSSCGNSKCASHSGHHGHGKPSLEQLLNWSKVQEGTETGLYGGAPDSVGTGEPLQGRVLSNRENNAKETEVKRTTPSQGGALIDNYLHLPPFRIIPRPLLSAPSMHQSYCQQHQETRQQLQLNNEQQERPSDRIGPQRRLHINMGAEKPRATHAADGCSEEQKQTEKTRGEEIPDYDATAAATAGPNEAITRIGPDALQSSADENQRPLPQLQHRAAGGNVVSPPARNINLLPVQPIDRPEELTEAKPLHQHGGIGDRVAAAGVAAASEPWEFASSREDTSTSAQSSSGMMNAGVLIERMMDALGLES